jgi:hypothetical protein
MLYALVAVFAACAGYAAGRLHQWYRMDADREEAYQAGYDAAARSTFTMAARMAGRDKSAVRASASVQPARPAAETPAMLPPPSAEARSGSAASSASPGGVGSGPAAASAALPGGGGPGFVAGPALPGGVGPGSAAGPALPGDAGPGSDAAPGSAGGMGAGAGPAGFPGAGPEPGSAAGPAAGEAAGRPPGFGTPFPVPKPPVFPPVARPAASPGVAGAAGAASSGAAPGMPGGAAAPGAPGPEVGHGDGDVSEGAATDSGAAAGPAGRRAKSGRATGRLPRRGRHLVPQELVRAATYRLSPDRVARAKVPGALPLPGDEGPDATGPEAEQPVKPTVPKPRSS